ncbi:Prolyl 3-hydroxylase sudestada1 [Eumeta japonica]|uniref:uS12 prolyl 3-hydroxylase n=1 Tax=Eumeta variegata TaxID=151549 RepID=A0A4C1Z4I1_EUMVA|nr:Prolyl 3-hydroxylase sudestada1 [Eumeta japonica]
MSSPARRDSGDGEASTAAAEKSGAADSGRARAAKRPLPDTVIEISDSDDSSVCAVNSYQASPGEVKRIRGGDDYSSSSSSYSSDSDSECEDDSVVLHESAPVPPRAPLNPRAPRTDDPQFNPRLKDSEFMEKITDYWRGSKECETDDVTLITDPFRLCRLHNFLANPEIIDNIVDDMNTLDWTRKKMDLYEFHQTADLARLTWQRSIRGIYELLKTQLMSWAAAVMGERLTHVSASCSLYGPGDHLLVHDDLLADRRVAFIFYLAPWKPRLRPRGRPLENGAGDHALVDKGDSVYVDAETEATGGWTADMGGALEMLARDSHGRPSQVVRTLTPANNSLVLFRVGSETFHQVSEVTSLELPRLSINGWFHGPAPTESTAETPDADELPALVRPHSHVVVLNEWVETTYMCARARGRVQAQMERASEVQLHGFLQASRVHELLEALAAPDVPWERAGPPDRCRYERLPAEWAACSEPHPARNLLRLVSGTAFYRLLADCTDLRLTGHRGLELQRWAAGDYTLLPVRTHYASSRLETLLYLGGVENAGAPAGGSTTFVAPEEADEGSAGAGGALVTVAPAANALALVFCEAGVARFTKYVSRLTPPPRDRFYLLTVTYCE